jgi:hypothetical protein
MMVAMAVFVLPQVTEHLGASEAGKGQILGWFGLFSAMLAGVGLSKSFWGNPLAPKKEKLSWWKRFQRGRFSSSEHSDKKFCCGAEPGEYCAASSGGGDGCCCCFCFTEYKSFATLVTVLFAAVALAFIVGFSASVLPVILLGLIFLFALCFCGCSIDS